MAGNKTSDSVACANAAGVTSALPLHFFLERYAEAYLLEMQAFVAAILEDKTPPVTGRDGRIPVVMAYAAHMSCEQHRPVLLSEVAGGANGQA